MKHGIDRAPFDADYFSKWNYADRGCGRFSVYWFARRYYAALVRRYAGDGGALLEIGSGLGHLLGSLQGHYFCVGIDVSRHATTQTRMQAPRAAVLQMDANGLSAFRDGAFRVVVALHVVEHLRDPQSVIGEIARILSADGLFLFATPNPQYVLRRWKDPTTDAIGKDETHVSVSPPHQWRAWCESAGLEVIRQCGDGLWDVPYVRWIPAHLQFAVLGLPAALQVLTRTTFTPTSMGVNLICLAQKTLVGVRKCASQP